VVFVNVAPLIGIVGLTYALFRRNSSTSAKKKFDNSSMGAHLRQIFLYHMDATTPPENVTAAVEAVHQSQLI